MPEIGHLPEHRRSLSVFVLAMLSLAVVISLRNLPLTAEYGAASIFFYVAAAICFMVPYALVAAELASGWPKAGGVYIWVREALGDRWGFFAIWMQWFHNMTFYPAMLAFVGAGLAYMINPVLAEHRGYLIAVILVGFWGITLLNFLGIKTSSMISTICVVIGVLIPGALLIGCGIYWFSADMPLSISFNRFNLLPDFSHPTSFAFLAGIFLAMAGLEVNANLAREVKNPQKNYPRAILIAALLTIIILILGSLSIAIVIPRDQISLVSGLFAAFRNFFSILNMRWLVPVIAIFTILGALGELNAWAIAGVKGLFVTTEHGCLPPVFHKLNKHHTPINLLLLQAVIVSITAFIFLHLPDINVAFWVLSALSAQMYLVMYLFLLVSGLILRYKKPRVHRAYQIPFGNVGMWIAVCVGVSAVLFAIAMSFLPPLGAFKIASLLHYELLVIGGLVVACGIPLTIYAFRRPHWQLEVLEEIREEIHKSTH